MQISTSTGTITVDPRNTELIAQDYVFRLSSYLDNVADTQASTLFTITLLPGNYVEPEPEPEPEEEEEEEEDFFEIVIREPGLIIPTDRDFQYTLTEGVDYDVYGREEEDYDVTFIVDLNNADKFAYYDEDASTFYV